VANVRLLPVDSELAETLRMGSEHFRRRYGVTVAAETAPILRGVVEQTLGMLPGVRREANRWGGYLAVDETSNLIVGTCAFKGPPKGDGTVEIAYYTFGPYEGQGYAKGMARALISVAHSSPLVHLVIAHTLPERNPSTSVLRSVGMRFVGEVRDPVDGLVWRWQLESGDKGASHSPDTP
jgi:[ribosomal protein S5]-alanine N-acetyltransferase